MVGRPHNAPQEPLRREDGVALEPAITATSADLHAKHGTRPATQKEFDDLFGDLPGDDEG
jgi:hypothetical protein